VQGKNYYLEAWTTGHYLRELVEVKEKLKRGVRRKAQGAWRKKKIRLNKLIQLEGR